MEAEVPWEWDASVAPKAGSCEIATAPLAFFEPHKNSRWRWRLGSRFLLGFFFFGKTLFQRIWGYLKANNKELQLRRAGLGH